MSKFLFSMVALLTVALGAKAQEYTATAYFQTALDKNLDTLNIGGYSWDTYEPLITLDGGRTIEVTEDSIIVSDWYGYGNTSLGVPYDLVCYLDDDGHITKYAARVGDTLYPYYNTYVYTGFTSTDKMFVGFSAWSETYSAYTQYVSDPDAKSGYLFLYGTEWYSGKVGYYFISWGDYKFEKGIYTYTAMGDVKSAVNEDGDSLIIGDYTWGDYSPLLTLSDRSVEVNSDSIVVKDWYGYGNTSLGYPYDLVCHLDDDGHITKFEARVSDTMYDWSNYVYTGFSDASNKSMVGFSAWTETYAPYTQCVSDAATKSGYLFLYGTEWYSCKAGYYFITWGDYEFELSPKMEVYTRESTSGWGTICLPYAAEPDAGTTAFEVAGVDNTESPTKLYLTEATMEAGKPYVFKTTAGGTATFTQNSTETVEEPVAGANNLVGYFESIAAQDGWYILSSGTWYEIDNASVFTMNPNRAYISSLSDIPVYTEDAGVKAISTSVFGDDATAISGLSQGVDAAAKSGAIYTLSGQRVSNVAKGGLYIMDGKKVLVK